MNVNSTFVLVCFLHVQVMISPQQAKPYTMEDDYKKCAYTSEDGMLTPTERDWIRKRSGVQCSIRRRKNGRHLSLHGNPTNFDEAEIWALFFIDGKIRIGVCKCMGFQSGQIRINKK